MACDTQGAKSDYIMTQLWLCESSLLNEQEENIFLISHNINLLHYFT